MTNQEFDNLKEILKDYPYRQEVLKYIKNKDTCIGCPWNDGKPHNYCYSCND